MKIRGLRAPLGKNRNPHPMGVDLNVMFRAAAQSMAKQRDERRRLEESGHRSQSYEGHDNLAVLQEAAAPHPMDPLRTPGVLWRTLGDLPFNIPGDLVVVASQMQATQNKCTLRELLERRLHRCYRNALVKYHVMNLAEASARARRAQIYIAEPVIMTQ